MLLGPGAGSTLKEIKCTLMQLDGSWGVLQLGCSGKALTCFRHAVRRTEALQAAAGVHSTGIEEKEVSRKESIFSSP